jgi:hypothetical protein
VIPPHASVILSAAKNPRIVRKRANAAILRVAQDDGHGGESHPASKIQQKLEHLRLLARNAF